MKLKRNLILSAGLVSLILLTTHGFSADPKPAPPAVSSDVTNGWQRRIPQFDSDNLPLGDVATQLRRQFPEVNFVVPESAGNAYVRLILRSVTLGDILKAIELASDGKIRASVAGTGQTVDSATGLPMTTVGSDARSNLVSFAFAGYAPDPPLPPENHVACRVFSLSPYLAGLSEKETDAAIKSLHEAFAISLGMLTKFDRDITSPDFQIHQGTKLLIAVGREKELVVIEQIIKELPGSAPSATLPSPVKNDPKAKTASPGPSPTGAK